MPAEWAKAVETLKGRLGTEVVGRWIEPLKVSSVSDDAVIFEAPNPFFRDWVTTHYAPALRDSFGGRRVTVVASASPPPAAASRRPAGSS